MPNLRYYLRLGLRSSQNWLFLMPHVRSLTISRQGSADLLGAITSTVAKPCFRAARPRSTVGGFVYCNNPSRRHRRRPHSTKWFILSRVKHGGGREGD